MHLFARILLSKIPKFYISYMSTVDRLKMADINLTSK